MQTNAVGFDLNGCNSLSSGEFFGLFFARNSCNGGEIRWMGQDLLFFTTIVSVGLRSL